MRKRIKNVSDLPEWFNLEKYQFAYELNALGWYEQLYVRTMCLTRAMKVVNHPDFNKDGYFDLFKGSLNSIRENPQVDLLNNERLSQCYSLGGVLYWLKQIKNPQPLLGVSSLTMKEYICQPFFIDPKRLEQAQKWYDARDKKTSKEPAWLNEPLRNSYQSDVGTLTDTLNINLHLPDTFLIESFKQYLSAQRKRIKSISPKHFRQSDFQNWAKLGILPFIDLILWEFEFTITIPYRVIADALYPNGDRGEETVRKTSYPLLTELTTAVTLNQLGAQASLEIAEKN